MLRILTPINLEKSRQTSAIIPSGIKSEFNDDLVNFAPLKFNLFNSRSAGTRRAEKSSSMSINLEKSKDLLYFKMVVLLKIKRFKLLKISKLNDKKSIRLPLI